MDRTWSGADLPGLRLLTAAALNAALPYPREGRTCPLLDALLNRFTGRVAGRGFVRINYIYRAFNITL
jgi:hypothetical protein